MLIGCGRVSSNEQDTAAQVAALKAAGCERIYPSGRWDRPEVGLKVGDLQDARRS